MSRKVSYVVVFPTASLLQLYESVQSKNCTKHTKKLQFESEDDLKKNLSVSNGNYE